MTRVETAASSSTKYRCCDCRRGGEMATQAQAGCLALSVLVANVTVWRKAICGLVTDTQVPGVGCTPDQAAVRTPGRAVVRTPDQAEARTQAPAVVPTRDREAGSIRAPAEVRTQGRAAASIQALEGVPIRDLEVGSIPVPGAGCTPGPSPIFRTGPQFPF
jgi:hypothetical protein